MTDDPGFNPTADALERAPYCLIVLLRDTVSIDMDITGPDVDIDIIGPFTSYEEAKMWSLKYPDAVIRCMQTPEYLTLQRLEDEEDEALKKPRN